MPGVYDRLVNGIAVDKIATTLDDIEWVDEVATTNAYYPVRPTLTNYDTYYTFGEEIKVAQDEVPDPFRIKLEWTKQAADVRMDSNGYLRYTFKPWAMFDEESKEFEDKLADQEIEESDFAELILK